MADTLACHCCGNIGPACWVDEQDPEERIICCNCAWAREYFCWEEIPFLRRADSLLLSHFGETIRPTIDKIEALLPPKEPE